MLPHDHFLRSSAKQRLKYMLEIRKSSDHQIDYNVDTRYTLAHLFCRADVGACKNMSQVNNEIRRFTLTEMKTPTPLFLTKHDRRKQVLVTVNK